MRHSLVVMLLVLVPGLVAAENQAVGKQAMGGSSSARATEAIRAFPDLPEVRVGGATVQQRGKIYYVGGAILEKGRFSKNATTIISLDPASDKWTVEAEMPGRSSFGAAIAGREIFFGGGMDNDQISDRHFAWNMVTKKLRETAPLPSPRYQHGVAKLNEKIYVVGGGTRDHALLEPSREAWVYDPGADTWTRKANLLIPMRNLCLVAYMGKLYAIGGHSVGPENRGEIVQEYDPNTDTWRRMADMPTPRTDISGVAHGGRIYVFGGHPKLDVVESYDLKTNTWRPEPKLPEGRFAPSAISILGDIIVVGGLPNNTVRYTPAP